MTTPQNPGDGSDSAGPQDQQDPQNPYGTPPPPPAPTAPTTPPPGATPPAAPPPYGDPAAPPAYGQPAYGQPAYGQPAPAQPGFPQYTAPPTNEAGKGLAITALILSFLACTIVLAIPAIIMAIVVLIQGRDGRNHGKGLAIAALIISGISIVGTAVGGAALYNYAKDFKSPNDLEVGDCITATGLSDDSAESVTEIKTTACSNKHDGEVLATHELTADEAASSGADAPDVCTPAITEAGKAAVVTAEITVTALTVADPNAGDSAACVAYKTDGSQLTGKLG